MKLHYAGKYDLNPDSLPYEEHMPGAVAFKEAKDSKQLAIVANVIAVIVFLIFFAIAMFRYGQYLMEESFGFFYVSILFLLILFPHEILHAICFKKDVYMYTNLSQGMLFVIGTETMSKARFVFMALLPNIIFGLIPFIVGMIFPEMVFFTMFGCIALSSGAGDYYNVFNALTQMPKGARTYMHKFNSYWYIP